jgi:hypothetical protein
MFAPNARAACSAWGFAINAMPRLADSYNAWAYRLTVYTCTARRAFAKATNSVPTLALPNDTCSPSEAFSINTKSTFTESNNTVPTLAISPNANSVTLAMNTKGIFACGCSCDGYAVLASSLFVDCHLSFSFKLP